MSNSIEYEPVCPDCGGNNIISLGYDYDLARVFYECEDCGAQGSSERFDIEEEEDDD